jgi:NADPH:quinone reductase-like Zn-dependent oxidoreductase
VGHLAVQVAKARGAYVIGTASSGHHAMLRDLGADELIDYTTTDFADGLAPVDVVLDPVSGDYSARSLRVLRPGGTLVSLLPFGAQIPAEAAGLGVRAAVMLVEADHQGMTALASLVTAAQLRPVIAATFPLADTAKAHELGETRHVAGKLVLTM